MRRLPLYLGFTIIAGFLLGSYLLYSRFGYVSAPGGDLYNHVLLMQELRDQGISVLFQGYPRLFHAILLVGTSLSGENPLRIMLLLVPVVVSMAALLAFFVMQRLMGAWAGLLALVGSLLVARQPLQTLYDGGFPNYINVAIWLPLFLLGFILYEQNAKRNGVICMVVGAVLMVMTHHFSALYIGLFALCAAAFGGIRVWRWLPFIAILIALFLMSPLGAGARALFDIIVIINPEFPWVSFPGVLDNPNAIIRWTHFPDYFTPVIWWGAVAALIGIGVATLRRIPIPRSVQALSLFTIILLCLSQFEALRFPLRVARDAGVYLGLLAVYGVAVIGKRLEARPVYLKAFGVFILLLLSPYIFQRIDRLRNFELAMQYTPVQDALFASTHGAPTVAIDQYLPSVAHPHVSALIAGGVITAGLQEALASAQYVVLFETNGATQATYEEELYKRNFIVKDRVVDPVHSLLIFEKASVPEI